MDLTTQIGELAEEREGIFFTKFSDLGLNWTNGEKKENETVKLKIKNDANRSTGLIL